MNNEMNPHPEGYPMIPLTIINDEGLKEPISSKKTVSKKWSIAELEKKYPNFKNVEYLINEQLSKGILPKALLDMPDCLLVPFFTLNTFHSLSMVMKNANLNLLSEFNRIFMERGQDGEYAVMNGMLYLSVVSTPRLPDDRVKLYAMAWFCDYLEARYQNNPASLYDSKDDYAKLGRSNDRFLDLILSSKFNDYFEALDHAIRQKMPPLFFNSIHQLILMHRYAVAKRVFLLLAHYDENVIYGPFFSSQRMRREIMGFAGHFRQQLGLQHKDTYNIWFNNPTEDLRELLRGHVHVSDYFTHSHFQITFAVMSQRTQALKSLAKFIPTEQEESFSELIQHLNGVYHFMTGKINK
jgi:hypothetical protein